MSQPIPDFTDYTDPDLVALADAVRTEQWRRERVADLAAQAEALNRSALDTDGIAPGDEWRQPVGAFDAYPIGWTVTHGGKTWTSLVAGNVWEPGVANWRTEGTGPAEWVQPTGATDAYPLGAQVTHNGQTWTSTAAANVWEPGVYGWTAQAQ